MSEATMASVPEPTSGRPGSGAYEVLYRPAPMWEVGRGTLDYRPGEHYPGDYAGCITAVAPEGELGGTFGSPWAVARMELTDHEAADAKSRRLKVESAVASAEADGLPPSPGASAPRLVPVTFDDEWGALSEELRPLQERLGRLAEIHDLDETERRGVLEAEEIARVRIRGLPKVVAHTGTGLYAAEITPNHNDDTQSGAPAGQVITLVTGGLGITSAWAGGYVTNATRSETRAIVSHTDGTVTLEGDLSNWLDTDDLDIYDAWSTVQGALDQLWTDQGSAEFAAIQEIRIGAGTFTRPLPNASLLPTPEFYLYVRGESRTTSIIDVTNTSLIWNGTERLHCESLKVIGTVWGYFWVSHLFAKDCDFYFVFGAYDCAMEFEDCLFDGNGSALSGAWHDYNGVSKMVFRRCHFQEGAHVTTRRSYGSFILLESCTSTSAGDGLVQEYLSGYSGSERVEILNCAVYDSPLVHVEGQQVDFLRVRNTVVQGGAYVFDMDKTPRFQVESDFNCFYGQTTAIANWGGSDKTWSEWQALGYDEHSLNVDPRLADPENGDFALQSDSPCRRRGAGAAVKLDRDGQVFDGCNPDMGAHSTGFGLPGEPVVESVVASGKDVTVTVSGDEDATHFARLLSDGGAVDDEASRSGSGGIDLASFEDGVFRSVVSWAERGERARSRPVAARPPRYFLSGGVSSEEVAAQVVSMLESSQGLADYLASPDAIHLSHPPKDAALPCLVYRLALQPFDARLEGELELTSWARSAAEARRAIEEAGNVFQAGRFETLSYVVRKPLVRGADAGLDGATGLRFERLTMGLVAHRKGD